jgi:rfaE bifunctional protein nucleotidyltransferase chain/domain
VTSSGNERSTRDTPDDGGAFGAAVDELTRCFRRDGKLLVFGNGGSAADAQHLAAELVGRFELAQRRGLPAIALTTDTSALTAIANDFGFAHVFSRQVEALGRRGDVALAISTSGSSPNVIEGVAAARRGGLRTIGLVGASNSELARIVDVAVVVAGENAAAVQEAQLVLEHRMCRAVEERLFDADGAPRLPQTSGRVVDWDELLAERERWRHQGLTVVWTNGCFDLLHLGHIRSLEAAKRLGDILVVGLNGDDGVRTLKGPGRPVMPAVARAETLAALRAVDRVVVFEELTPEVALERLRPDVHTKGADYADRSLPERDVVESFGGRIEFLPLVEGFSTSEIVAGLEKSG